MACKHLASLIKTQEEFYEYDQKQLEKMQENVAMNDENIMKLKAKLEDIQNRDGGYRDHRDDRDLRDVIQENIASNQYDKLTSLRYIENYKKQIKQTKEKLNDCYKMYRIV